MALALWFMALASALDCVALLTSLAHTANIFDFQHDNNRIGPLLPAKFHLDRFMSVGLRPPKPSKLLILPI